MIDWTHLAIWRLGFLDSYNRLTHVAIYKYIRIKIIDVKNAPFINDPPPPFFGQGLMPFQPIL